MTDDQDTTAAQNLAGPPASTVGAESPVKRNTAVIVLSLVVAVQMILIVLLAAAGAYLWGNQASYEDRLHSNEEQISAYRDEIASYESDFFGMGSPEEEEAWMLSDQMGMEVGYLIVEGDLEAYLDLYDSTDPHVDFADVEADFLKVAEKASEVESGVEYISDMMPAVYEDGASGESIIRISVSGMNFMTGGPVGGRLTIYILNDDGDLSLTGKEGRDLSLVSSGMY